ncbi:hypothetical protein HJG53_06075 [Sphingomonas sp. ID1715]|uniref:hypothetical protein n=1 Tax=Sphingomonas sp. ID1715 TaxID=1656898 RepID=UPI001488B46D|nr:hypothetical protein [Sphingomonas sp. ID1715]NNM76468.1 hypothetical protein [Sphingomonas sp. ID1715]
MFALMLAAAAAQAADAEPLYEDTDYGRQMTVAEIRRDVVGNSLVWNESGTRRARYVAPDGSFVGGRAALRWHFRDYDNLFCVDSGDPATSGCVQFLRQGNTITWRRKDGLIEVSATIAPGNAVR